MSEWSRVHRVGDLATVLGERMRGGGGGFSRFLEVGGYLIEDA